MKKLDLALAQKIVSSCLETARKKDLAPIAVALLDLRGVLQVFLAEDGIDLGRPALAIGKANAALQFGIGTRGLAERAKQLPVFFTAAGQTLTGGFIPNPGGVLIRSSEGILLGALGVSGDVGDRDEEAAIAAIHAHSLQADID